MNKFNNKNNEINKKNYSYRWKNFRGISRSIRELLKDLDFENKIILDVNCGIGDLIPFIAAKTNAFKFIGLDKNENFIYQARKLYPSYIFELRNYFENPLPGNFDVILCLNGLNVKDKDGDLLRRSRIKSMYQHCNYAFAFNMAGNFPQPETKNSSSVFKADSLKIVEYCLSLTSKVIFRQNYDENEFTIIMFK